MARRKKENSVIKFDIGWKKAAQTIPEGNIKTGPDQALLLKLNEMRCLIPIQSIEVDHGAPARQKVENWASENGWTVVEHNEDVTEWVCISTLCKGAPPSNRVGELRKIYTTRYLSYLVARHCHEGEITADDDLCMFSTWLFSQLARWAEETRGLTWRSEYDKPKWSDSDHEEFGRWLEDKYLADETIEIDT